MPNYKLLEKSPFHLKEKEIKWVKDTLGSMTIEEKVGQLFCMMAYTDDESYLNMLNEKYHIGGFMGRPMSLEKVVKAVSIAQTSAKIPLFISANFEAGGDGFIAEGTNVGPNMQIGATGDVSFAVKQAYVCAREGLAAGANYAFAPVIDIDYNFRNPIMATRLYSSDPQFVTEAGAAYTKTAQEMGMAVSIKHFPGDGVDERDQHLVTSINSMSCDEWDKTFGEAYKASIEAGALTVMIGHIMLPAYSRRFCPGIKDEDIMPATLAPELLNDLLREKLGFNGMIITDASSMAGMCIPMDRRKAVPYTIAAGCDMFLFTKNMEEDINFMKKGYEEGIITPERLDEAVMRILGTKAALRLPEKQMDGTLIPNLQAARKIIGCEEHKAIERECADRSVTLVKNKDKLIPLDANQYRRILLYPLTMGASFFGGGGEDISGIMKKALEKEGFEVTIFETKSGFEGLLAPYLDIVDNYDLILYIANLSTKSNQTTVRIEWAEPMGANCPNYLSVVPTIFISFANPYHLLDVPRIRTMINAYKFKPANVEAVIDKMLGRSEFKGTSPVDAFCGRWDTKL